MRVRARLSCGRRGDDCDGCGEDDEGPAEPHGALSCHALPSVSWPEWPVVVRHYEAVASISLTRTSIRRLRRPPTTWVAQPLGGVVITLSIPRKTKSMTNA